MKVHIYYDDQGRIVSIVEMKADKATPPAGIFSLPDCKDCELELSEEQARTSLIELHIGYRLDLNQKQLRLVPLVPRKDKPVKGEPHTKI